MRSKENKKEGVVVEPFEKLVPIEDLKPYWRPKEIGSYCAACVNYNQSWSCPPHLIDVWAYLAQFSFINIIARRLTVYDKDVDVLELFEKTRRELGTELINQCELPYKQALIAGHCFICEFCTRKCGETCTYPDQLKYSLESLGFSVGDISKDLLGISIKWHTEKGEPTVLVAIGAILSKN